jgi:GntR family transcriptional regulator
MAKRGPPAPLRYHIRNAILDLLIKNGYCPGDQIPTEQELIDILDVSRSSLREGLHLLEEERIIRTKHGTGRYLVSTPQDYKFDITHLQSVTEMLAGYNIQTATKVLKVMEIPADPTISTGLGIPDGYPVIFIERIQYAKDIPIIYSIDIIPKSKLPVEFDKSNFEGSLVKYLEENCGLILDYTRSTIRAVNSLEAIPSQVQVDSCAAWILLEQVNYDRNGEAIIYSKDYHRGDYITFHVNRYRH